MVNLQKIGDSAVKFVFTDSDHYLYGNGEIEVPVNSLLLVIDESEMVTFKKLSGDPFLSFRADNSNLGTKAAIEQFYKDNMVGSSGGGSESGITSGEVQTMIDESISGKADTSDVTAVANDVSTLSGQVQVKVAITDFNAYSAATDARIAEDEEVTAAALNDLQENKADTSAVTAVQQSLSGKQDTLVSGTNIKTINNESILGSGNITISGGGGQSLVYYTEDTSNESATIMVQNDDGLGNRSENRVFVDGGDIIIESYNETDDDEGNTGTTDTQVYINSLGLSIIASSDDGIDTTQTELEVQPMGAYINSEPIATEPYVNAAISGKVDTSAVTAVNDALTAHTANTTVHVTSAEKTAWNAKQDALYIYTEDNNLGTAELHSNDSSIIFNAGGASITANNAMGVNTFNVASTGVTINGENVLTDGIISTAITSGSTDSEIPTAKATYDAIQAGGGGGATYSAGTNISIDTANTINCTLPITANTGNKNVTVGYDLNVREEGETSIGKYNVNRYRNAATHSENTIFTVGNGGNNSLRHNALEIRKNGDLYFADTSNGGQSYYEKPMVRLQDMYWALGGLKFVQCTQAEYSAMEQAGTLDANTLYIVSNVVS